VLNCIPNVKDIGSQAPFSGSGETRSAVECFSSSIPRRGSQAAPSRARIAAENADKSPKEIICVEVPAYIQPLLIARLTRERIAFIRRANLRTSCCLSLAKLTAVVESVEGDFSVSADLDEVAVGITHVAAPFPAVIVLMAR
jgi:hypothetical protein